MSLCHFVSKKICLYSSLCYSVSKKHSVIICLYVILSLKKHSVFTRPYVILSLKKHSAIICLYVILSLKNTLFLLVPMLFCLQNILTKTRTNV